MDGKILAVTFDLWDTIIVDESDEPKRVAKGLLSKYLTRRELVCKFLEKHEPIARELVDVSYAAADAAFHRVWYQHSFTWSVSGRLDIVLKGLGVDVTKIVHVGDRDSKDIKGPQNLGAKGIYTTVVNDRGSSDTSADAICRDYAELPGLVDSLNIK
jgi:FMN phosphatase YigB (HAD superfamily)